MFKSSKYFAAPLVLFLLAMSTVGCTIYSEKKPPTLATTTSAEEHERILWQLIQKRQWAKLSPLFAGTLVWHTDGKSYDRAQLVPYLQSLSVKDAVIRDVSIQPNGQDMTVGYTLQLAGAGGSSQGFVVLSVWQQLKNGGYILIAHSQQPRTTTP